MPPGSFGHWGIDNQLHWVRDVTYDKDRSQIRTGAADLMKHDFTEALIIPRGYALLHVRRDRCVCPVPRVVAFPFRRMS